MPLGRRLPVDATVPLKGHGQRSTDLAISFVGNNAVQVSDLGSREVFGSPTRPKNRPFSGGVLRIPAKS
jgi:hypothetical protein